MSNPIRVAFALSIVANIVLAWSVWRQSDAQRIHEVDSNTHLSACKTSPMHFSTPENFEALFVHHNDSVYRRVWGHSFQDWPESAFLVACSYYYVTKQDTLLHDNAVSKEQLEQIYHSTIVVSP